MFDAVIFDFDGLILDTETPLYAAWQQTFEHYGVPPISLTEWSDSLGRADDDPQLLDPLDRLAELAPPGFDRSAAQARRRSFRDQLLDASPVLPGVHEVLDQAAALGIPVGIASSSPVDWLVRHLEPRGILDRFAVLSCAGNGVPGKPDPAVYLTACQGLGAVPHRSLALEDSPNGATAAKAAGMTCAVVPNDISRDLDLDHADRVVNSLLDISLRHGLAGPIGPAA